MAGVGRRSAARASVKADSGDSARPPDEVPRRRRRGGESHTLRLMGGNTKLLLGFGSIALMVAGFIVYRTCFGGGVAHVDRLPRDVTPFPGPKLTDLPQVRYDTIVFYFLF